MTNDLLISSYNYNLPEGYIAQTPVFPRDRSRLLVVDSPIHHQHRIFRDLPQLLRPGDLLVLNNTRVIPARLYGRKVTGTPVEVLLLEERESNCWLALVKPGRRLKVGTTIIFEANQQITCGYDGSSPISAVDPETPEEKQKKQESGSLLLPLKATIVARDDATSGRVLQFDVPRGKSLINLLPDYGQVPFPPYITDSKATPDQYQTVYAKIPGAVAAPTAGLHFTPDLLKECQQLGIQQVSITLHVGVGTFRPVEVEDVTNHQMHGEWLEVSEATVEHIYQTKASGGRVIAVGTTVVRALEGAAASGKLRPYCGKTELFIYPGYKWQVVDGLITNFHLPRSTLLMLVSALIGRERVLKLYAEAIASNYRFYSFGDAMLILPEAVVGFQHQ